MCLFSGLNSCPGRWPPDPVSQRGVETTEQARRQPGEGPAPPCVVGVEGARAGQTLGWTLLSSCLQSRISREGKVSAFLVGAALGPGTCL